VPAVSPLPTDSDNLSVSPPQEAPAAPQNRPQRHYELTTFFPVQYTYRLRGQHVI